MYRTGNTRPAHANNSDCVHIFELNFLFSLKTQLHTCWRRHLSLSCHLLLRPQDTHNACIYGQTHLARALCRCPWWDARNPPSADSVCSKHFILLYWVWMELEPHLHCEIDALFNFLHSVLNVVRACIVDLHINCTSWLAKEWLGNYCFITRASLSLFESTSKWIK